MRELRTAKGDASYPPASGFDMLPSMAEDLELGERGLSEGVELHLMASLHPLDD
ncbi:MAG: hypothetical protein INR64_05005 [Caulobacteraceae bacterium]|nr:hypothetical protein [Caulobacter sp.]